jgi:Rod binding domain-containing protein
MALAIAQRLEQPPAAENSQGAGSPPGKLSKAAREFESMLLQNWLEKMNQSFAGSEPSQDAAHDTVSSLGTQAISTALAARGGIGIAAMLLRQLQPKPKPAPGEAAKSSRI